MNPPKGGWGYLILICAVLVNVINQGLLLSTSLMAAIADRSFHLRGPQFGVYTGGKTNFVVILTKGAFFSESEIRFSNLPKKLFQKTIPGLKFEIPAHISKQLI